jgi:hypothetical protein
MQGCQWAASQFELVVMGARLLLVEGASKSAEGIVHACPTGWLIAALLCAGFRRPSWVSTTNWSTR